MTKKSRSNKEPKLTRKQADFVKNYISDDKKTRFNGTQSALKSYNTTDDHTAEVIASENLSKPVVSRAIDVAMEKAGLTDDVVGEIHHRNLKQSTNLNVSQQAVRDYHKVKGYTSESDVKKHIKVGFFIINNNIDKD